MLRVNFKEMEWQEGLTVEGLLQEISKDKAYALILRGRVTVIVNNGVVSLSEYGSKILEDGDDIRIYPAVAGG